MTLEKLPEIDASVKKRFVNAVKEQHDGKKWGVLKEEVENALLFYMEVGPLSEEHLIEDPTTGDVEKIKLTIPEFFKRFDNIQVRGNPPVYYMNRMAASELKEIVREITGNRSDHNWRKWSKILKESGRIKQLNGTPDYRIIRENFNFIDKELKEYWDEQIEKNRSYLMNIKSSKEDVTYKIYDKLIAGGKKTVSLAEIKKLGKIPESKAKKTIRKLEKENKLRMVDMGWWKVVSHEPVKNLENPASQLK